MYVCMYVCMYGNKFVYVVCMYVCCKSSAMFEDLKFMYVVNLCVCRRYMVIGKKIFVSLICICIYVCMYVCMYVCTYVFVYVLKVNIFELFRLFVFSVYIYTYRLEVSGSGGLPGRGEASHGPGYGDEED